MTWGFFVAITLAVVGLVLLAVIYVQDQLWHPMRRKDDHVEI